MHVTFEPLTNTVLLLSSDVLYSANASGFPLAPATLGNFAVTVDGVVVPTATLSILAAPPPAVLSASGFSSYPNATAYRLSLNLSPRAAGGEQLRVAYPASAAAPLVGLTMGVPLAGDAFTFALSDLRPPAVSAHSFTPTAFAPEGHAIRYEINISLSELAFPTSQLALGASVTGAHFAVYVGTTRLVSSDGVTFAHTIAPSPAAARVAASDAPRATTRSGAGRRTAARNRPHGNAALPGARRRAQSGGGTASVGMLLVLAGLPPRGQSVLLVPIEGAVADGAGNILPAVGIALGDLSAAAAPPPPVATPSPDAAAVPPAPPALPPYFPGAAPLGNASGVTLGGMGGGTMGIVIAAAVLLLLCCCWLLLFLWRRRRKQRRDKTRRTFGRLLDGETDEEGRKLSTLKQILSRSRKGMPLELATEEVLAAETVLPLKLSAALSQVWRKQHENDPDAESPSDAEKCDLLLRMMRPPLPPPAPPAVLQHAFDAFEQENGRPPMGEHEALSTMKDALEPHVRKLKAVVESGLMDAIEEAAPIPVGVEAGGGVRLRPPPLKPAKGDHEWKAPPPPPPPPPGLELSALPVAVLEASTAMFGNHTAPVVDRAQEAHVEEQLSSLRKRLDTLVEGGKRMQDSGEDTEMDNAGELPEAVLEAGRALFQARNGRPPISDVESASLLRKILLEAGVGSGARKTRWREMVDGLPPPPPPMIQTHNLPDSLLGIASALASDLNFPKGMDPEVREQRELHALQKRLKAFLDVKMPKLVVSMVKADAEKTGHGHNDAEAVGKLLEAFSEASISDVASGPDGGGGAHVHPPKLRPSDGKGTIEAWKDLPPPPPQVDLRRLPSVAMRAAGGLGNAVAQADEQTQMLVLRSRLQEYFKAAMPADVMAQAHAHFKTRKGKAAATDQAVVEELSAWINDAKSEDVQRGWDGGGGARVVPPRPRPAPASGPDGAGRTFVENEGPPRPLRLGAVPLSLVEAVGTPAKGKGASGGAGGASGGGAPSAKSLLGSILGGGKASSAAAAERRPLIACDATALAPQLGQLLRKLDRAVEQRDEVSLNALPPPVRTCARDMFVARHGTDPRDEVESLLLLRAVMEESGVRLPDAVELLHADAESVGGAPPPLPNSVIWAALDLDGGGGFGAPGSKATPQQLSRLHDMLESITSPPKAYGWSELPVEVQEALTFELKRRTGDDEPQTESDLLNLAKEVVAEAEETRRNLRDQQIVLEDTEPADTGRGMLIKRVSFVKNHAFDGYDPAAAFGSLPPPLSKKPSSASGRLRLGPSMPVPRGGGRCSVVGGFGFVQDQSGADNDTDGIDKAAALGRRSVLGRQQSCGRVGGRRRSIQVVERDLSSHHLALRREDYNDSVRQAVGALKQDKELMRATSKAKDAPALVSRLSSKHVRDAPPRKAAAARFGSKLRGLLGGADHRISPSSPEASLSVKPAQGGFSGHYAQIPGAMPRDLNAPPVPMMPPPMPSQPMVPMQRQLTCGPGPLLPVASLQRVPSRLPPALPLANQMDALCRMSVALSDGPPQMRPSPLSAASMRGLPPPLPANVSFQALPPIMGRQLSCGPPPVPPAGSSFQRMLPPMQFVGSPQDPQRLQRQFSQ